MIAAREAGDSNRFTQHVDQHPFRFALAAARFAGFNHFIAFAILGLRSQSLASP
jgi:hypothetical protein